MLRANEAELRGEHANKIQTKKGDFTAGFPRSCEILLHLFIDHASRGGVLERDRLSPEAGSAGLAPNFNAGKILQIAAQSKLILEN